MENQTLIAQPCSGIRAESAVNILTEEGYTSVSNGGGFDDKKDALEKVLITSPSHSQQGLYCLADVG